MSRVPSCGSFVKALASSGRSSLQGNRQMAFCGWFGSEKYKDHFEDGIYVCSKCDNELFSSTRKFQHSSAWPAFTHPIRPDSLHKYEESKRALKVLCGKCKNGLGHEFIGDGPKSQSRF